MSAPTTILVLKTGALGDVLRTTSILPGLRARYPGCRITWLTARGAVDLVRLHPLIDEVVGVDPRDEADVAAAGEGLLERAWTRVLSFDDELPLCRLAARLAGLGPSGPGANLSGAFLAAGSQRAYTRDVAPWFDMGLLSIHGKEAADRLKVRNERSHPAIYADMLGIPLGEPELPLTDEARALAAEFAQRTGLHAHGPVLGLNTGAGGRWESKRLEVEKVGQVVEELDRRTARGLGYLLLGGRDEASRNAELLRGLGGIERPERVVDAGTDNSLLDFAGLIDRLDLLLTSDSLALHVAVARRVPVVSFFAPTSAAEIELYGRGERVVSTAPDYCSYRSDTDTSTLTVERLADAVMRWLPGSVGGGARPLPPRAREAGRG